MKRKTVFIENKKHFAFLGEECNDQQLLINVANELGIYEDLMAAGYKLISPNGRRIETFNEVLQSRKNIYGFTN